MPSPSFEDRITYWQRHVDQHQQTDLSGAAYCQRQGLVYHQFTYWRRKLSEVDSLSTPSSSGFSQVVLPPSLPSPSGLHLRLPDGVEIHGIDGSNVAVVHQLLARW